MSLRKRKTKTRDQIVCDDDDEKERERGSRRRRRRRRSYCFDDVATKVVGTEVAEDQRIRTVIKQHKLVVL